MKFLSVMLAFLLAAAPLPGLGCTLSGTDGGPAGASVQHSGAGVQHSGHAAHPGGQHDSRAAQGHDCCAANDEGPASACDGGSHCLSCPAGTIAMTVLPEAIAVQPTGQQTALSESQLLPAHSAPPYRPPTALS